MLDIPDGWKAEKFTREHNPHGMLETTTFATLFPKYLEKYIKECWPLLVQTLKEHVCMKSYRFGFDEFFQEI